MLDRIDARRQVEVAMRASRERIARLLGRLTPNEREVLQKRFVARLEALGVATQTGSEEP